MQPAPSFRPGLRPVLRRDGTPFADEVSAVLAVRHCAEQWFGPLTWRADGLQADLPDCRLSLLCSVQPCSRGWYGTILATPLTAAVSLSEE